MKLKGIALMAITAILSVCAVVYSGYKCLSFEYRNVTLQKNHVNSVLSGQGIGAAVEQSSNENNASDSGTGDSQEGSVPAASSGQALGKILAENISPYSANTQYNKVYLKNSTSNSIDLKSLLSSNLSFSISKNSEPQVLIVHTHTTETYMTEDRDYYTDADESRSLDESRNMIAIGNIIENKLVAAGIGVIHDKTVHDYPSYSGSYTRAYNTITGDLKTYPQVKIVIDIHRDAISRGSDKIKPVVNINGKQSAQVMLVMGSEGGSISNFPNWRENLKFAVKYQQTMEVMYPGLARALALNEGKYNEHITPGSILLEVGSDANTLEEAKTAAECAGNALVGLLNTIK